MKLNKPVDPSKETSKDDSSDIQKVKQQKASAPPQPKASTNKGSSQQREDEEAQKGHS
ncbi:hypothetical protein H8S95_08665 [Pontibacter sp. KCTC 32443]|uniref:hypothetical protein n=1 Tax=Pontibacter TaxID=323449 RepID=UPI00164DFE2A|nr:MULTISPECIES: hypothetical protein [Pontibacter]MBC5774132.1 hypothetical protein [Pontibacter sp. KCTC 32443]